MLAVTAVLLLIGRVGSLECAAQWNASLLSVLRLTADLPTVRSLPFGLVSRDRTKLNSADRQVILALLDQQWPACGARGSQQLRIAELCWFSEHDQEAIERFALLAPATETSRFEQGSILFQKGEYEQAAAAWVLMSSEIKRAGLLPYFRQEADIAFKTKRFQDALNFFEVIIHLDTMDHAAVQGLADSLATLGRWNEAKDAYLSLFEFADQADPDFTYLVAFGDLLVRGGKLTDALSALDLALELDPDSALAWLAYGNALSQLARHTEAGEAYQHALLADPTLADGHVSYGIWLLVHKGRNSEAEAEFDLGVTLDHDDKSQRTIDTGPWLYQKIIVAYWFTNDLDAAREWSKKARLQYPDHFLPAYMTGYTEMKAGTVSGAIDWFLEAIKKDPHNPESRVALAEAYERLGMIKEAMLQRQVAADLRRASGSP